MRGVQSVQPQYPARVAEPWARILQSVYNPGDGDGFRDLLGNNHLTAGTGTGELTRSIDLRGRRAFKGTNGANGYARKNSVAATLVYPIIIVTVASYATTGLKTCASFGLGGAAIGAPNSKFMHTGHTSSNNAFCYEFNGARTTPLTKLVGTAYGASTINIPRCSVSISRSATEHYLWVDGVEYSSVVDAGAIDDSPHNVALGALATASAVITFPIEGNVSLAAFGYGVDAPNTMLRDLSLRPWSLFSKRIKARTARALVPGELSGGATLDDMTAAGTVSSGASDLSGGATLGDMTASGSMGASSGTLTSPAFKNWMGTVLAGATIPKVAIVRVSDMAQVLTLTNQVTSGAGVLSITNAAITPGVQYLLVTCNADGSDFGCEPLTAA